MDSILHPFEAAGLGLAPFQCVGHERRVGPLSWVDPKTGVTVEVGAPGQAMGTCQFCGTGIAECFRIRSSDGRTFIVGSDCVRRTYREVNTDVPLDVRRAIAEVAAEKREIKREAEFKRLMARVDKVQQLLLAHPWLFTSKQHPNEYYAKQGKTLRDYYEWMLSHGGVTGKTEVCRAIERYDAEQTKAADV